MVRAGWQQVMQPPAELPAAPTSSSNASWDAKPLSRLRLLGVDAPEHHRLLDRAHAVVEHVAQEVVAHLPRPARARFRHHVNGSQHVARLEVEDRLLWHVDVAEVRIRM